MVDKHIKYVSFDPGLATGWTTWGAKGEFIDMGTAKGYEELFKFLEFKLPDYPSPDVLIYENFRLRQDKALVQSGSEMPASIAIGLIKYYGFLHGCEMVEQEPSIKTIAEKWTGVTTKNKQHKDTHVLDAFNHGEYYFIRVGIKEVKL